MDRRPPADGQCQIRYRNDSDESIAVHLTKWIPNAEFLGCCITRVKDAVVISDSRK